MNESIPNPQNIIIDNITFSQLLPRTLSLALSNAINDEAFLYSNNNHLIYKIDKFSASPDLTLIAYGNLTSTANGLLGKVNSALTTTTTSDYLLEGNNKFLNLNNIFNTFSSSFFTITKNQLINKITIANLRQYVNSINIDNLFASSLYMNNTNGNYTLSLNQSLSTSSNVIFDALTCKSLILTSTISTDNSSTDSDLKITSFDLSNSKINFYSNQLNLMTHSYQLQLKSSITSSNELNFSHNNEIFLSSTSSINFITDNNKLMINSSGVKLSQLSDNTYAISPVELIQPSTTFPMAFNDYSLLLGNSEVANVSAGLSSSNGNFSLNAFSYQYFISSLKLFLILNDKRIIINVSDDNDLSSVNAECLLYINTFNLYKPSTDALMTLSNNNSFTPSLTFSQNTISLYSITNNYYTIDSNDVGNHDVYSLNINYSNVNSILNITNGKITIGVNNIPLINTFISSSLNLIPSLSIINDNSNESLMKSSVDINILSITNTSNINTLAFNSYITTSALTPGYSIYNGFSSMADLYSGDNSNCVYINQATSGDGSTIAFIQTSRWAGYTTNIVVVKKIASTYSIFTIPYAQSAGGIDLNYDGTIIVLCSGFNTTHPSEYRFNGNSYDGPFTGTGAEFGYQHYYFIPSLSNDGSLFSIIGPAHDGTFNTCLCLFIRDSNGNYSPAATNDSWANGRIDLPQYNDAFNVSFVDKVNASACVFPKPDGTALNGYFKNASGWFFGSIAFPTAAKFWPEIKSSFSLTPDLSKITFRGTDGKLYIYNFSWTFSANTPILTLTLDAAIITSANVNIDTNYIEISHDSNLVAFGLRDDSINTLYTYDRNDNFTERLWQQATNFINKNTSGGIMQDKLVVYFHTFSGTSSYENIIKLITPSSSPATGGTAIKFKSTIDSFGTVGITTNYDSNTLTIYNDSSPSAANANINMQKIIKFNRNISFGGLINTNSNYHHLYINKTYANPSSRPTTPATVVPVVFNTSNDRLYLYVNRQWRYAQLL